MIGSRKPRSVGKSHNVAFYGTRPADNAEFIHFAIEHDSSNREDRRSVSAEKRREYLSE